MSPRTSHLNGKSVTSFSRYLTSQDRLPYQSSRGRQAVHWEESFVRQEVGRRCTGRNHLCAKRSAGGALGGIICAPRGRQAVHWEESFVRH